jgi:hypothetical protein
MILMVLFCDQAKPLANKANAMTECLSHVETVVD